MVAAVSSCGSAFRVYTKGSSFPCESKHLSLLQSSTQRSTIGALAAAAVGGVPAAGTDTNDLRAGGAAAAAVRGVPAAGPRWGGLCAGEFAAAAVEDSRGLKVRGRLGWALPSAQV